MDLSAQRKKMGKLLTETGSMYAQDSVKQSSGRASDKWHFSQRPHKMFIIITATRCCTNWQLPHSLTTLLGPPGLNMYE
jgi:hypothetical protein